jgi:hypothetical protein
VKRLATLALATAAVALGGTSALAADGGATIDEFPVSFTMSSATCPNLPAGTTIVGTGTMKSISTERTDKDGITTSHNASHAHGTATDQAGNTYVFNYENNYRVSNSAANPLVFSGRMTDSFSLAGKGPAKLQNGFQAIFTIDFTTDPPTFTFDPLNSRGDPLDFATGAAVCDPL